MKGRRGKWMLVLIIAGVVLALCRIVIYLCPRNTSVDDRSIVILYDNDVHCRIEGYSLMRGLADEIGDTAWVGLVSSGDFLHGGTAGAISGGSYVTAIMREMGYDAIGLGNHEFDFGVPHMVELFRHDRLPVINMNLYDVSADTLLFSPYAIRSYGARKVAFIGVVTPESMVSEEYSFYDKDGNLLYSLVPDSLVSLLQRTVDRVRAEGAGLVVVLSHLGESSSKNFITSHNLIASTEGIDVVLDGHTHSVVPCDTVMNRAGRPVIVTNTGSLFGRVGKLVIDSHGGISTELISREHLKKENRRVREVTDSIRVLMEKITSRKVCHCPFELSIYDKDGRQAVRFMETGVGNLVADAFRYVSGAQLAVNNGGGIRTKMPVGDWTYGDIIALLPYNNYLQVVSVSGADLLELLRLSTANSPEEDGQFPQISGFRFCLDTSAVGDARISGVEVVDDKAGRYVPLSSDATYTLCTTDYCVSGGGMYGVLRHATILKDNIMLYNDALNLFVTDRLHGVIPERYADTEGRILLR